MNVSALQATSARPPDQIADYVGASGAGGQPLTGKALRNASPAEQRKEVAAQFEAILVRQLLGPTMASMLGKDGGQMLEQQLTPRAPRANFNSPADSAENL